MFTTITTERLVIRAPQADDVSSLADRRSDPEVAKYVGWETPYPPEAAADLITRVMGMGGPENEQWWMAMVTQHGTGTVVGDVAIRLTTEGRTAEIGYTFAPDHWGHGYAVEACQAMIAYLFETVGVRRVAAWVHPENTASAAVLERTGFLFEGKTKSSHWIGTEVSDEWIYGLTRDDWEAWKRRPRQPMTTVNLVEIDQSNESEVFKLRTHKTQEAFVAPMQWSYADALFPETVNGAPVTPWLRAIHADDQLAGFLMLALTSDHHPEPYLWRLLIDRMFQRRGIGKLTLDRTVEACRAVGAKTLLTSWVPGRGSPEPFYLAYGFQPTGKIVDDEIEARFTFPVVGKGSG